MASLSSSDFKFLPEPAKVKEEGVVGFEDDEQEDLQMLKKKKKKKMSLTKKPGGFQSMGLSFPLLKAIQKRGYKVPTPIQRKTIPLVLEGRDVVAMARTGSGKTAAFLIPMFERLKCRGTQAGIRTVILSPTRELALQTMRFVKELGRYTGLKHAVILGGDSMESQFSSLHTNPDIVVATPGRLLHICVEMELKLDKVEMIIFDEADRLFEMGFGDQLKEIINRLPQSRQTLLFSATLPKILVEFARAGLSDPVLIRLDVESKLPETLKTSFIACRPDDKPAALLCVLKNVIKPESQTIVFVATKHHVEYIHCLLNCANIKNTFIYSDLDPSARKINAAKFQTGQVPVLVVTDVAARGIDVPQLDYVINYNFPAKPKLFVHRVGRCARAGREGWALSLVSSDEVSYMLDIHLFLGRPLTLVPATESTDDPTHLGVVPSSLMDVELSEIDNWQTSSHDLVSLKKVSDNGYKHYIRCRQGASRESVRRGKEINISTLGNHALFNGCKLLVPDDSSRAQLLTGINSYRPPGNIFEIGQSSHSELYTMMKKKRQTHKKNIIAHKMKEETKLPDFKANKNESKKKLELSNPEEIFSTFSKVVSNRKVKFPDGGAPQGGVDKENFIPYKPSDFHSEQGLSVGNFHKDAAAAGLDLSADTEQGLKRSGKVQKVWDRKKKKMVGVQEKKKIRSESGAWIDASFKSGRYKQWVEKNNADQLEPEDLPQNTQSRPHTHWAQHNLKMAEKKKNAGLKRPDQILKARLLKEKRRRMHGRKKKN